MTTIEKVLSLIQQSGMGDFPLEKKIGLTQGTIKNWRAGKNKISADALSKLADYFNVSVDYLLGRAGNVQKQVDIFQYDGIHPIEKHHVPMIGEIACGQPIYADEDRESYVEVGTDIQADFCLTARGDSMIGARIQDGDIVFCRETPMVNNGRIGVIIIGDEATLKRVYYYPEKQKLVLQSENPKYEPLVYIGEELEEIRILGEAIAFQSDL